MMGFRSSRFHHQHGSSSTSSERKDDIQIKHYVVLGFLEVGPISLTMTTVKVCVLCIDELHSKPELGRQTQRATARAGKWDVAGRSI